MTVVQKWVFFFAAVLIALAVYFAYFDSNGLAGGSLFFAVALIMFGAVNPDTIEKLVWRRGELGLHRHISSKSEINEALSLVEDERRASIADEPLVQSAEDRDPAQKSATDYLLLATNAWKEKHVADGLQYAYQGLGLNPANVRVKASLESRIGMLFMDLNAYEQAVVYLDKAIETDPGFSWPYNNLGILLHDQERFEEAEDAYRTAIVLEPGFALAHNNLGALLKQQRRIEEAEEAFREAIKLDPDFSSYYYNLAILLDDLGRTDDVEDLFQKAITLDPDDTNAHYNLALLLKKHGRQEEADEHFRIAKELRKGQGGAK